MKDYLSIREFSKMTGIEHSTLRYWDKIGLFSPALRDADNNYRYYSPEQIIAVKFITVLSSLNLSLKSISAMGNDRTPESVVNLLIQQEKLINLEIRRLVVCSSVITTRLTAISYGSKLLRSHRLTGNSSELNGSNEKQNAGVDTGVLLLEREEEAFVLGPPTEFKEGESFYEPFLRFCKQAKDLRINLSYPIGGYHKNMASFLNAPAKPENFLSLEPSGSYTRPAGQYLVGFTRGYYGSLGDLPAKMADFASENSLTPTGPVYTIYLHDETCLKDPAQYLSQACVAVTPQE
jgi:DNA-binding transcriptional MerR regulator/effector-binding domain-containing protein